MTLLFHFPEDEALAFELARGLGWQQATIDFVYVNGLTPDTLYILASSSSLDYAPSNGSIFYIDDVSYDHTPAVLPAINGGITVVSQLNGIVGSMPNVNCSVRNLGLDTISSFDIEYSYNGGTAIQESIGPISLTSLSNYQHTFNSPVTLVSGNNSLTVTVSNVNGAGPDGNPSDDFKTITVSPKVSAPGKVVLGEEATGTWCGWCPRGAVFMDYMESTYGNAWAGVAVHNNDPMADSAYDTGLGFSSYPNALVDRGLEIDPQALEAEFL